MRWGLRALARHWVAILVYLIIGLSWLIGVPRSSPTSVQTAYLISVCLLLPMLYYWTTRSATPARVAILRALGLAISAITFCGWLIVDRTTPAFWTFVTAQSIGAAVIVLVEIRISVLLMSAVFRHDADKAKLAEQSGLPQFLVSLMIAEAKFWKMIYRGVSRVASGRKS